MNAYKAGLIEAAAPRRVPEDLKHYQQGARWIERARRLRHIAYCTLGLAALIGAYSLVGHLDERSQQQPARLSTQLGCPKAKPQQITTFALVLVEGVDGGKREVSCAVVRAKGGL